MMSYVPQVVICDRLNLLPGIDSIDVKDVLDKDGFVFAYPNTCRIRTVERDNVHESLLPNVWYMLRLLAIPENRAYVLDQLRQSGINFDLAVSEGE